MTVTFYTLGCKVNQYETEACRSLMQAQGWKTVGCDAPADVVVINSCTVTAESDRKLRQLLRRLRRERPSSVLAVTGCMPQAFPEQAMLCDADIILGNAERHKLPQAVALFLQTHQRVVDIPGHTAEYEALSITAFEGHTRAFVKIQDGCNRFCTYCIIPYARGRVRSRPLADLRQELECLAAQGFCEIVLVGINLTAYGQDTGGNIADAVEAACAVKGIARVRLGSIEPDFLTPDILTRLAAQEKFCPQFHLALQSGCDATLRRMSRHYTTAEYAALCADIRTRFPDAAITTDVMVGFPGETEAEFAESLDFVARIGFARTHVFAYSRRPGTPAAKMAGQPTAAVKAKRSRQMQEVSDRAAQTFAAAHIGKTVSVLLETLREDGFTDGYTPAYLPVLVRTDRPSGDIVQVHITAAQNGVCVGEEVSQAE